MQAERDHLISYFYEVQPLLHKYVEKCCFQSLQENIETQNVYLHVVDKLILLYIKNSTKIYTDCYKPNYFMTLILFSAIRLANKFLDDDTHFSNGSTFANNLCDYHKDIYVMNEIEHKMFKYSNYNIFALVK